MRTLILAAAALATLTACDNSAPDAEEAAAPPVSEPAPTAAPPPEAPPSPTPQIAQIPAAIQGRWGLVPADCTSTRGDAKGLLTIGPDMLRFYESVGTLAEVTEASDTRIRAAFEFTGEGMTWQRDETLDAQDGGKTLIRREYGDEAAPGPFKYTKCA